MERHIPTGSRVLGLGVIVGCLVSIASAQTPPPSGRCQVFAVPTAVRAEGLAERLGDLILQCSGSNPGAVLSGNLTIFLPVNITNRVDDANQSHDVVLSVDYGNGFVPTGQAGLVSNQSIAFNGLNFTVPASGALNIKVSNLRGAVNRLGMIAPQPVTATFSFSSPAFLLVNQSQLVVAYPQPGLFATLYSTGITCTGSPLPDVYTMTSLFTAGTAFASTRLTEGFGSAFAPRSLGDDSGTRFLVKYSGFPANAHLYIPNLVAGSDAQTPTAGGDLGLPQSVGQYVPGSGTLLLVRVQGADGTGAGGNPVVAPTGSSAITLDSVSEVPLVNGSGYAVYEVADSNPSLRENAQFPTFIGLQSISAPAVAQETVSLAPVSTVTTASVNDPVPRYAAVAPASDCSVLGDCQAAYFPKLFVQAPPILLTGFAGGAMDSAPGYIPVQNLGGGIMNWTAAVNYVTGAGWIQLDQSNNQNNGAVRVFAHPQSLGPGTYQANVVIDAGPLAGKVTIPVTLKAIGLPSIAAIVKVGSVVNAATFAVTPLVPGSLGTVMGSNLAGKNVSATFDGITAPLLYTGATQINLQVPPDLGAKTSASLVVTVDGVSSTPYTVALAPAWPSIFDHGVRNQDNSENGAGNASAAGSILQIYLTGIPAPASVSVQIGSAKDLVPVYAGVAPGETGVQQVNVAVPAGLPSGNNPLTICANAGGQSYCSSGATVAVQ